VRFLALGAGVQSTAVLMLALRGDLPPLDAAIFADTGHEPAAVYAHLERMRARCVAAGLDLEVVTGGDIRDFSRPAGTGSGIDAPFYTVTPDGDRGIIPRQCTRALKIRPMRRAIRRRMAATGATTATQVFGISADEYQRMRDSDVRYLTNEYPLVDLRWTRNDCRTYLADLGIDAPRSACIGCPFHSDNEWRSMRDDRPDEWREAIAWESDAQAAFEATPRLRAIPYVHRSRVPLADVDLWTPEDHGQLSLGFGDECGGVCGV